MTTFSKLVIAAAAAVSLSACTAEKAFDTTVDGTLFVGKTAAKAAVGAGKLAYRGGSAAANALSN